MQRAITTRMFRQVKELERCTAAAVAEGEQHRNRITWEPLAAVSAVPDALPAIEANQERLWQVLGKVDEPRLPTAAKARHLPSLSTPGIEAFDVVLDVFDGVFAWGVLLVPAAALLATDSDWPVVVCQHGLEGLPSDTIGEEGSEANYDAYKAFTRRLAERGFVTFAPHNPCESPALPVSLRDCPDVRHDRRLLEWSCEESSANRACSSHQSS